MINAEHPAGRRWPHQGIGIHGRELQVAAEQVCVVLRHQDEVAASKLDGLAARAQPYLAAALRDDVEEDDVVEPAEHPVGLVAGMRFDAPRRAEARFQEDRTIELHCMQQVGQGIHRNVTSVWRKRGGGSIKTQAGEPGILASCPGRNNFGMRTIAAKEKQHVS